MSLVSAAFLAFVAFTALIYYLTPGNARRWILLLASLAFCASCGFYSLVFVLFATVTTFIGGLLSGPSKSKGLRNAACIITVVLNLGILCAVRYYGVIGIFAENLNKVFGASESTRTFMLYAVPVGMAFYTLQLIGYTLDCRWERTAPEKDFFRYLLFATYFPYFTSGPMNSYADLSVKLDGSKDAKFSFDRLRDSAIRIAWGFFKKLVIADRIALVVNAIYGNHETFGGLYVFIGAACFAIQLYADFSGCMDVVLGASHLLGIEMPENFNSPFLSHTIREYWQRWHITLGGWLRDYLFYPMLRTSVFVKIGDVSKKLFGKKKGKKVPTYFGLIILWAAVGYWHGGLMKYVIGTGLLHCFYIILGELVEPVSVKLRKALHSDKLPYKLFQTARTFFLVCLGHIFFRANNVADAAMMYKSIFQPFSMSSETLALLKLDMGNLIVLLVSFAVLVAVDIYKYREKQEEEPRLVLKAIASKPVIVSWAVFMILAVAVLIFGMYGLGYDSGAFIYARI